MKTVFDNRQVCHVWAQQSQEHGRGHSIHFRGKTIYSWGEHFPLATFLSADLVLLNSDNYSVSTSKHKGYVRGAVNHKRRIYAPTDVLKVATQWRTDDGAELFKDVAASMVRHMRAEAYTNIRRALSYEGNGRMKKRMAKHLAEAESALKSGIEFCTELNVKVPKDLQKEYDALIADSGDVLTQYGIEQQRQIKEAQRLTKLKAKKDAKLLKDNLADWQQCRAVSMDVLRVVRDNEKTFMRVNGDDIETSKGARFPVSDAIPAFKIVRLAKERGATYTRKSEGAELPASWQLGHFRIDVIEDNGNVRAGCHYVEWDQIEHCARVLEIYP